MKTLVKVELWSEEPTAVAGTARTFAALHPPGMHQLVKLEDGYAVETSDPGFVAFAAERQGYVKRVLLREEGGILTEKIREVMRGPFSMSGRGPAQ